MQTVPDSAKCHCPKRALCSCPGSTAHSLKLPVGKDQLLIGPGAHPQYLPQGKNAQGRAFVHSRGTENPARKAPSAQISDSAHTVTLTQALEDPWSPSQCPGLL